MNPRRVAPHGANVPGLELKGWKMKRALALIALLAAGGCASDPIGEKLAESTPRGAVFAEGVDAAAYEIGARDPQIRNVRRGVDKAICGEIKDASASGPNEGYRAFVVTRTRLNRLLTRVSPDRHNLSTAAWCNQPYQGTDAAAVVDPACAPSVYDAQFWEAYRAACVTEANLPITAQRPDWIETPATAESVAKDAS